MYYSTNQMRVGSRNSFLVPYLPLIFFVQPKIQKHQLETKITLGRMTKKYQQIAHTAVCSMWSPGRII